MHNTHFKVKWFIRGLVFGTVAITVFSFIVMLLWNWLMPTIFSLTEITFWQAAGLLILSKIIFSGFGRKSHEHFSNKREFLKKKFEEKCKKETGEQEPPVGNES